MNLKILMALLFLVPAAVNAGLVGVPKLERPVTDLTGTLTPEQIAALEGKITDFEQKKGSQIAVLMLPTTQPEDIAEYGIKVADLWQIGRRGTDDGVILIVAKDDRQLRLEVGYGLEGVIPDAVAKRIISETITPHFKNNDYAGGIDAGVDQLMRLIEGEPLPPPAAVKPKSVQIDPEGKLMTILFIGLVVGAILAAIFGRTAGGLMAGIGSASVVSLLLGFSLAAVIVGFIVFFLIGIRQHGGPYWSSGGWGGGFGGGRGHSDSWGGGGGRFGGGGASGSW